ncbi:ABC transporter ATP-binding protein [Prosthecobacter vanneervenii]|uniref:ABC-type multidrug transport system fused ATPase/permease subunit n=1 Tax=Prosthecobacter vanneervenii TaxID=48466 RepID=A0A7W8DKF9_9BACT|nr:ABC transporter ATP-binding protein [Prosthecobacter vanneervenii]MBB5033092.1 ABC-type multidrug transport system fused ATPase/permease subunit [Prosthecobacter vanneervenii]
MKKEVLQHLYKLVEPHRGRFLLVAFITLLSTGAGLIEPLIYREAINDIAGLFVKHANDKARAAAGEELETSDNPVEDFLRQKIHSAQHPSTHHLPAPTKKTHEKKPHTQEHVAERTPGEAIYTLLYAVLLMLGVNVISYILWLYAENKKAQLDCDIEQEFIQGAFAHVLKLPLGFFGKRAPAAIAKQIDQSEEVSAIVGAFSQEILPEFISLFGIMAIMFYQNTTLALISISLIPIYLIIAWRSSQKLETGLNTYYERWEDVSARINTALEGIKTVKLSGAETREVQEYRRISSGAYDNYVERSKLANKFAFWEGVLSHLATAMVLGCGGYLALVHKLTPGDVVMFVAYLDRLYSPIDELCSLWVNMQQHIASISRAFRLLENKSGEKPGQPLQISQGRVEFKDVCFSYVEDHQVLKSVSMTFAPGTITAIVGGSGTGKTTAVDLLLKLYAPQQGEILIDGQPLSALDSSSVRGHIGMVAADGAIFRGTLAYNLRYKRPDATDAEVMKVVEQAGLKNLVDRLPEGLQTQIGQNGMGLSVGERQRVQIARVLLSRPKILVLDEATANLDYNTEAEIRHAIHQMRSTCTIIIIAHRFSMVHNADHVYVLGGGGILEQGTPEELIAAEGWFAAFAHAVEEDVEEEEAEDAEESEEEADEEESEEEEAEEDVEEEAEEEDSKD